MRSSRLESSGHRALAESFSNARGQFSLPQASPVRPERCGGVWKALARWSLAIEGLCSSTTAFVGFHRRPGADFGERGLLLADREDGVSTTPAILCLYNSHFAYHPARCHLLLVICQVRQLGRAPSIPSLSRISPHKSVATTPEHRSRLADDLYLQWPPHCSTLIAPPSHSSLEARCATSTKFPTTPKRCFSSQRTEYRLSMSS